MATAPKQVTTRRLAIAAQYGYAANEVIEDGVNITGIRVLVTAYQREQKPSSAIECESGNPTVLVHWATEEQRQAAWEASEGDFRESIGEDMYADILALRSEIARRA